ncbi:glycerophosphodiester phosphodiesterase [Paludibacter jiangxiensis]|uniref:Glycerophosphoryl diester phosphodiesterase n=1 Tax=Paludibacter jiangxiensis TaxID=681398 RepID=A0A170YRG2_9BACT|nr:glycerophosphodiester phosphodiesterase family protein [Paludibacter jiangxiensis]GAT62002.1 glycerophosphoryl diester phosphodiesterase [Paludibacter jiangxiensis]
MNKNTIAKVCLVGVVLFFATDGFGKTNVIAHRGYWKTEGSTKNSISSLSNAQKLGIYGSETDVHLTADGAVIINHDDTIQGHDISSTPLAVLKTVKLSNGEALPTLEEYLNQTRKDKKTKLIIEIKNKKDTLLEQRTVRAVVNLVKKMKMSKAVEYISFSMNACKTLLQEKAGAPIAYLAGKDGALAPAELKKIGLSGLDYHHSVLIKHPEWIAEAHSLGLTVNAWTVNDSLVIRKLIDLGADFITTDEPVIARKLIVN